jgi:Protein of unknown function (DUF2723)
MTPSSERDPATELRRMSGRLAPAIVVLLALAVYVATLMPGQAFDDWGEAQTAPHVLGVAHPTGYPTYTLAAWLFELLPLGSVAWRANLLSAVCVAIALGAQTAIGQRLGVRPWLAALAALATGAVATVWSSAVVAEVNPLHVALMALLIHRSLVWSDGGRARDLGLVGLLVGLSLGNHLLALFVAPFFVTYALWAGRRVLRVHPGWLAWPVAGAVAGASVYLYIPLAASLDPPLSYNHPVTIDALRYLVTGEQFRAQYSGLTSWSSVHVLFAALGDLVGIATSRATVAFPALGLVGLAVLVVRRPAFGAACWCALIVGIDVWANYQRLEHYLLVPWLLLGIGVGQALEASAALTRLIAPVASKTTAAPGRLGRLPSIVAAAAGVLLVVGLVAVNAGGSDRSRDRTASTYVDAMLGALPPDAAILSFWGGSTPLWHARFVEGRRPDVLVVDDTNIVYEGWGTRERRIAALICERPVFILRPFDNDLAPTRQAYRLVEVTSLFVGRGAASANSKLPLYRVEPLPGRCP